ncbi:MAG: ATP-dependent sacrificial sulfur transferase LarE [Gemmatimonadetes bacterium]|nr:ATP-dependent sacrificial sulfur transferase LarE [Gemmatimonadota bacterium]NNM06644.1 ATP-dependent sacrificial sulfur transferase LarE [Gemmatimonadota bacterium]
MDKGLPIIDPISASAMEVDREVAQDKLAALKEALSTRVGEGALVAFSGGMDSAFLLWAASAVSTEVGGRVVALTTTSPSTPARDREDARGFTRLLGVEHVWEESYEMDLPEYSLNDRERCYHCKTELFRITGRAAGESDLRWILYGYNASDRGDDRPGHRAALEAGVLTPLADAELTKGEIRFLMKEAGLPLSGKAASPCLSSRVMTGIQITPERLADVEELEGILRKAGAEAIRVRICREADASFFLRVEASPGDMNIVLNCREELQTEGLRRGYRWVTLDLGGYRTGGGVT